MTNSAAPTVFLVGAGPGDPGLLTLRGAELLGQAELVLYDQLVAKRLLDWVKPGAELVCVRDLPGNHPDKYPHIFKSMIEAAQAGKVVVRLKGGDPQVFGRGGEEAEALRQAGVRYEIVPGVTAALAAAAYLDIPLTHRQYSSAVAFVTGHELPMKPGNKLDWEALAKFPGTLAIYMGIARMPLIVAELLKFGKDPLTPAAIIERASTGDMRSTYAPLQDLELARRQAGLEAPGLIMIGEVVDHRAAVSWFEQRPLFGLRVLVTRPRHQAEPIMRQLENLGAVPVLLPSVEIREPSDFAPVDAALDTLHNGGFDWIVFSSANGVHSLMRRLRARGRDLRDFAGVKFATVGPKTAEALLEYHLNPDLIPSSSFNAEGMIEALLPHVAGKRVLLARANKGRDLLRTELSKICTVEQVAVYEQIDAAIPNSDALAALRRGEIRFVTLSSSNVARSLIAAFDDTIRGRIERGEVQLVTISPETSRVVRELGYHVAGEATSHTGDGLIEAVTRLAQNR